MTKAREKLTLGWRRPSPARPAAPLDDYIEVKANAAETQRELTRRRQASAVSDSPIRRRLDNWAKCMKTGRGGGGRSPTAIFCDRLKKEKLGLVCARTDPELDPVDAELVSEAVELLPWRERQLLKWHYLEKGNPAPICRKLGIKLWPARHLSDEVTAAEHAVEKILDSRQERHKIPSNNLFPST